MDFLRQQWTQIQERLAGLNASQRMLLVALVVISIFTMLYWGRYASTREMVPLSAAPLSTEDMAAATQSLRAKGINFTTSGSMIMVPADDQWAAISDLSFNELLPTTPNFFEKMFEKQSLFGSATDYRARHNNARELTVQAMIQRWPDVKSANVLINEPQQGGIGRFEPRATISIETRSNSGAKKLANSASRLVLNAVSGLQRQNISVTVDGQAISMAADDAEGHGDHTRELVRAWERDVSEKIRGQLSFIPSIRVNVMAEVDTKTRKETMHNVLPDSKIVLLKRSETETSVNTEPTPSSEPGVIANAGVTAQGAVTAQAGSTLERTTEENEIDYGKSQIEIQTPAGSARIVGAALRVPRSHIVNLWRGGKPAGEPTDAEYEAVLKTAVAQMREEVRGLTGIVDDSRIVVNDFPDFDVFAGLPNPGQNSGSMGDLSLVASRYAKEAAIGVLALASLFMVSRMVKKAVPTPAVAIAGMGMLSAGVGAAAGGTGKAKGPATLVGDEFIAGDVAEGGAVLMGQELDPATLETAQMVEQVTKYVKENPDTAAALIRRLVSAD